MAEPADLIKKLLKGLHHLVHPHGGAGGHVKGHGGGHGKGYGGGHGKSHGGGHDKGHGGVHSKVMEAVMVKPTVAVIQVVAAGVMETNLTEATLVLDPLVVWVGQEVYLADYYNYYF